MTNNEYLKKIPKSILLSFLFRHLPIHSTPSTSNNSCLLLLFLVTSLAGAMTPGRAQLAATALAKVYYVQSAHEIDTK